MTVTTCHTDFIKTPLKCPECGGRFVATDNGRKEGLTCRHCNIHISRKKHYWDFLTDKNKKKWRSFTKSYSKLRRQEGWSEKDTTFYEKLPYRDKTGNHVGIWKLRKLHWDTFLKRVLARMEVRRQRPLYILDAGCGNGWAANRLAQRGHNIWAVDINADELEGLGAHSHYNTSFESIRAAFDQLPFTKLYFDLVLFNASLHYTANLKATLNETLRVLRYGGEIVIMDSPYYSDPKVGRKMVHEKNKYLNERGADSILTKETMIHYLDYNRMRHVADELDCDLEYFTNPMTMSQMVRKSWRRLRGARKEARMPVTVLHRRCPVHNIESQEYHPIRKNKLLKVGWLFMLRIFTKFIKTFFYNRPATEHIAGISLNVDRNVFNPRMLQSGKFVAKQLSEHNSWFTNASRVLDLGTGSGISAMVAARYVDQVKATDINPDAVRCARENVENMKLNNKISVFNGDLFDPVRTETFDLILFNPPFYQGKPKGKLDHAWRSENIAKRFARQVNNYLAADGVILLCLSDHGEPEEFLWNLSHQGFYIEIAAQQDLVNEILTLYKATDPNQ